MNIEMTIEARAVVTPKLAMASLNQTTRKPARNILRLQRKRNTSAMSKLRYGLCWGSIHSDFVKKPFLSSQFSSTHQAESKAVER